jgi:hypothetical protein
MLYGGKYYICLHRELHSLEISPAILETKTFDDLLSSFPHHRLFDFDDGPFFIAQSPDLDRKEGFYELTPVRMQNMHSIEWLGWSSDKILLISSKSSLCPIPKASSFDLDEQYKIPFENYEEIIYERLVKDIVERMNTVASQPVMITRQNSTVFAPMVHLTNTSGSGKTRSAIELGNLTNVILIKFFGNHGIRFSEVGVELRRFMKTFFTNRPQSKCVVVLYVILQRLIYACKYYCTKNNLATGCVFIDEAVKFFIGTVFDSWHSLVEKYFFADLIDCFADSRIIPNCRYYDVVKESKLIELSDSVIPKWQKMSLSQLVRENKKFLKERSSRLKNGANNEVVHDLPDLIIVLDEVHDLMASFNVESQVNLRYGGIIQTSDIYELIRGTLRSFEFFWDSHITITISTMAKLNQFSPPPANDPSFFSSFPKVSMLEPIVLSGTFDALCTGPIGADFIVTSWDHFLFSYERLLMISSCGRPLWAAHFGEKFKEYKSSRRKYSVVGMSLEKDRPYQIIPDDHFYEPLSKIAKGFEHQFNDLIGNIPITFDTMTSILALSVALLKYPSKVEAAELVRVGGMALLDFDGGNRTANGVFCSEGLFNGCASLAMVKFFAQIVNHLEAWTFSGDTSFLHLGEFGELFERMLLVRAVSTASRAGLVEKLKLNNGDLREKSICELLFEPVAFEDFLHRFCGKDACKKYLDQVPGLKGSFVAFNHFYHMGIGDISLGPYDVIANALSRGAGVVPKNGTKGSDCLIPLVLASGKLSFIFVQTKIGNSYNSFPNEAMLAKCSPAQTFGLNGDEATVATYAFIYHIISTEKHSFQVLKAGDGLNHLPCLAIKGIYDDPMTDDGVEPLEMRKLKALLRKLLVNRKDPEVCINRSIKNTWTLPDENRLTEFPTDFLNPNKKAKSV